MSKTVSTKSKIKKPVFGTKGKEKKQDISREYPRSYRLDSETMGILRKKLEDINATSPKKITEARLVKTLILLSRDIENDKILKAAKEVW